MTIIVQRTCTEVLSKTEAQRREPITGPLELFRSAPAYVLLGDPGSGKSTTFKTEADLLGAEAISMSARDFLASDVHSHPEWRGKTLFIDALDEMRVGSGDRREALDSIRRSLDALGRPPLSHLMPGGGLAGRQRPGQAAHGIPKRQREGSPAQSPQVAMSCRS